MKQKYPKSERCPTCKRIIGGTASNPGNWYCDYCKVMFGVMIDKEPYNLIRQGSV